MRKFSILLKNVLIFCQANPADSSPAADLESSFGCVSEWQKVKLTKACQGESYRPHSSPLVFSLLISLIYECPAGKGEFLSPLPPAQHISKSAGQEGKVGSPSCGCRSCRDRVLSPPTPKPCGNRRLTSPGTHYQEPSGEQPETFPLRLLWFSTSLSQFSLLLSVFCWVFL